MENKKEKSWFVRLPYSEESKFFLNDFTLSKDDVEKLKNNAIAEGRTLGRYIAYHLKQLLK